MSVTAETITTTLRPIDGEGLAQFATKGRDNPETRGTNKVHTVTEGVNIGRSAMSTVMRLWSMSHYI